MRPLPSLRFSISMCVVCAKGKGRPLGELKATFSTALKVLQCSKTIMSYDQSQCILLALCVCALGRGPTENVLVWVNEAPPPLRRGVGGPPPPLQPPKLSNTPRGHTLAGGRRVQCSAAQGRAVQGRAVQCSAVPGGAQGSAGQGRAGQCRAVGVQCRSAGQCSGGAVGVQCRAVQCRLPIICRSCHPLLQAILRFHFRAPKYLLWGTLAVAMAYFPSGCEGIASACSGYRVPGVPPSPNMTLPNQDQGLWVSPLSLPLPKAMALSH